jgi:predicted negative regulator of RcsB-dependent stress response
MRLSFAMHLRVLLALLGALLFLGWTTKSLAAEDTATLAAAEAAFDAARKHLDAGELDQACAKFEASQRLSPAVGTLLNLADCHERAGRTATAWATFRSCATLAR